MATQGAPEAPSHPVPPHPAPLLTHRAGDVREARRVVDPGEEAQGSEGCREDGKIRARRAREEGPRDPGGAEGEEARRPPPVREIAEGHVAEAKRRVGDRREEAQGQFVRGELAPPGEVKEDRDREDVAVDQAVDEAGDGEGLPLRAVHTATTRLPLNPFPRVRTEG